MRTTRSKDRTVHLMAAIAHFLSRPGRVLGAVVLAALGSALINPSPAPKETHATAVATHGVSAYWTVASDGGVFAFGGLPFYGSMGGVTLNRPMVGIAPTTAPSGADGGGYWTVASDGGVFSFGSAQFHGSMGAVRINAPMVGIAADPSTGGYWTVASDGGVFSFDAPFFGSMGGTRLNKPVVAMAATPTGRGYWLFASDGGVFAFGDAGFFGSLGGHALSRPLAAIAAADPGGYWLTDTNGAVSAYGDAGYFGSAPQHIARPMVAMADGPGTGIAANGAFPSGTFGYDISRFQDNPPACTNALPSGHTIGIVEVTGQANGSPNPCLAHQAAWAGAGLNLYIFMTFGTDTTNQPGCNGDAACNWGYEAGRFAFQYTQAQNVNPLVTWWIDVENANWSASTAENDQAITGAMSALRDSGVNNVGIYTSPLTWNGIAGKFQPPVPLWVAWYTNDPPGNCANVVSYAAQNGNFLPTGGVWVTQYTNQANGQSLDGDYAC